LLAVVAQADERQDHDGQPRRGGRGGIPKPSVHLSFAAPAAPASYAGKLVTATGDRADQVWLS
jgi:hypothetical protein